jgi:hypothetical protein
VGRFSLSGQNGRKHGYGFKVSDLHRPIGIHGIGMPVSSAARIQPR